MANGRSTGRANRDNGRAPGAFIALPVAVLDCPGYKALSHPARSLLIEVARQFHGDDNGRMLLSRAYLAGKGWKSADVIHRAVRERTDRDIGDRAAAEEPDVAGRRVGDGLVEIENRVGHEP